MPIEHFLIFYLQGGLVWIRKSSNFYKALKKQNQDGDVTVFYHNGFPPSDVNSLECQLYKCTRRFIEKSETFLNYIVGVVNSSEYSRTSVGSRVFVEESENTAVMGTVILKTTEKLTVRLDSNGSDIIPVHKKIYLLPFQLDTHGA